ncbi:Fe-S cluster assembly scaffold SufA [Kluyvera ascorbata]|uniref:Fe-S cluster assembly scaffold SufA n=1 Tax=Kluyvera ascorbata TaxID=51288 RepID=UPI003312C26C|nr:Fe-S cluster assembly scaffold SufA [Kluyvera ascorbata]HDG1708295.1 Fe-S cluster assembly scaffold SufA [Kluyvera ascorbata]
MDLHSGTFDPNDVSWRGITLTPSAAAHIRELVKQQPSIQGVRLGVKQTGCAGFGYVLDAVNEPDKDDLLFEADGAKLWVPLSAMPFIDGTEVDYVREGLNQLFKYHNPKAQNECGCGESFGV